MIDLNMEHSDFDMDMEVLCLLPRVSNYAGAIMIADDLGSTANEVLAAVSRLKRNHNIGIVELTADEAGTEHGRQLGVFRSDWLRAKRLATNYYGKVYGVGTAAGRSGRRPAHDQEHLPR